MTVTDEMVEAAARAFYEFEHDDRWDEEADERFKDSFYRKPARAALEAALGKL